MLSATSILVFFWVPMLVATRSRSWVCVCSLAGTEGLNSTGGFDVRLL